jgi:hypothetical protein
MLPNELYSFLTIYYTKNYSFNDLLFTYRLYIDKGYFLTSMTVLRTHNVQFIKQTL